MEIVVEFAGIARVITRTPSLSLAVEDGAPFKQIIRTLGMRFPALIGEVIGPDGCTLMASNMLNLNGRHMVQPSQMDQAPMNGDRLILMSVLAGG